MHIIKFANFPPYLVTLDYLIKQTTFSTYDDLSVIHSFNEKTFPCSQLSFKLDVIDNHQMKRRLIIISRTAICHTAMSSAQCLWRHLVLWLMMCSFSWQRSAGGQRCAQPIRGKPHSCTSVFQWQFGRLTPFSLTVSESPSQPFQT